MLPDCSEFQSQSVQICRYVFHHRNGPNQEQTLKIQWFLLNEICTDTNSLHYCGKKQFEEVLSELGCENTELGMSIWSSKTTVIFVGTRGWYQNGCKEAQYGSHVEQIDEECGFWRSNIICWPRTFGMCSTWMQRNYSYSVQKNVRLCWRNWKITRVGKTSRNNGCVLLRCGRTSSKMRWTMLWVGKQESGAVISSFKSLLGWSPFQEWGIWLFANSQIQTQTKVKPRCWSTVACGLRHHKHKFFSRRVSVVHLWRQWSSDQNDHSGQKSHDETRVQNPQSCSW